MQIEENGDDGSQYIWSMFMCDIPQKKDQRIFSYSYKECVKILWVLFALCRSLVLSWLAIYFTLFYLFTDVAIVSSFI